MRCFIAIDIDEQIKTEIKELVVELKDSIDARPGDMKWVKVDMIHLTLKFLGDVEDSDVPKICEIAKKVVEKYKHFHVEIAQVGSFGDPPNVIWVGINDGTGNLEKMADELEEQLLKFGIKKEGKKFAPHLTLCRIKSFKVGRKAEETLDDYEDYEGPDMPIESVCVYQSQISDAGPEYTLISKVELK